MRTRWLLARLVREPVSAWPRRFWERARPRSGRVPDPGPTAPRWPWPLPGPVGAPPRVAEPVPGDPRSSWEEARGHGRAWSALAGRDEGSVDPGTPATAHEGAFRLVSGALCVTAFPGPDRARTLHRLAERILERRSEGTSAHNHAVAERAALALAARLFPDSPLARRFRSAARELPALLEREIDADGFGIEKSAGYHLQNLEWGLLARQCGVDGLDAALGRGARTATDLLDADGALPDLGDDDGGRVLPGGDDARTRLGAVCRALRLPVPEGWAEGGLADAAYALPGPVPAVAPRSRHLPHAGLTILRVGPHLAVFDHGAHGCPPLFAHAHADALGVWWAPHGRWAVGGRGTGTYLGDADDRRFRRGTSAHPALVLDGADQGVPHDAPFLWRSVPEVADVTVDLPARTVSAGHDGWVARRGVHHRRTVTLHEDGSVELRDALLGTGRHHVAVLAPAVPGATFGVQPDPRLRVRERPDRHSRTYGRFEPASTIACEGVVDLPTTVVTRWTPRPR